MESNTCMPDRYEREQFKRQGQTTRCKKGEELTTAAEIEKMLETLGKMSEELYLRVDERLSPLCFPATPHPENPNYTEKEMVREFPPLFDAMRRKIIGIEKALVRINAVLDRCGV